METVIISVLTSIVVSLFTFILGLKSGKNQADRAFLQNLYKQLYAHFSELATGLEEKRPKRWEDYKSLTKGNITRYYPDVREMERTGDILYLKNRIFKRASQLEMECLNYKYNIDQLCLKVNDYLFEQTKLFNSELIDSSFDKTNSAKTKIETANSTCCKTYRLMSYDVLLDKKKLLEVLESRDSDINQYALSFTMRGNPPQREFILYPDSLAVDNSAFAETISKFAQEEMDCAGIETDLLKRIEALKRKLAKRAKNPTSFWETFAGAFMDIFH